MDDLLDGAVREDLGETYSIGVSITPYIQVGTWEIVIEATGAAETLDQSLATIIDVIEELTANGPTDTDFAQAKAVARDDYQLDNNDEIIGPLLRRRHLHDALVGTPSQRLQALGRDHRRGHPAARGAVGRHRQPHRGLPHPRVMSPPSLSAVRREPAWLSHVGCSQVS